MKCNKQSLLAMSTAFVMSMSFGASAFAQDGPEKIAVPYERENAWNEIAMVNDDMIETGVYVRAGAGKETPVIGSLYKGGAAWVINKGPEWTELYSGGLTGFVKNEYLVYGEDAQDKAYKHGIEGVKTTWDDVKMFSDVDAESDVIKELEYGDSYILLEAGSHWIEVQNGADSKGYVSSEDVSRVLLLDTAVSREDEVYTVQTAPQETYTEEPVYEEPVQTEVVQTEPETQPVTEAPVQEETEDPGYSLEEPEYVEPNYDEETTYEESTYEEPEYEEPVYEDTYEEPSYEDDGEDEEVYDASDDYYDADNDDVEYELDENYDDEEEYYDADAIDEEVYDESDFGDEGGYYDADTETYVSEDDVTKASEQSYSQGSDDVNLLGALIYCEAGNQSYDGMVAVGAVVMNRVNSSSFPGSVSDVIYQSGQFTPAYSGDLDSALANGVPSACYDAAAAALGGENPVGDALYFNAGSGSGMQIGDHQFY